MELTPQEKERLADVEMAQFRAELRSKQSEPVTSPPAPQPAPKGEPFPIPGLWLIWAILVAVGIAAAAFVFTNGNHISSTSGRLGSLKRTITSGQTVIRANGYIDYKIEIVPGMNEAVVEGSFKVTGDQGDAIAGAITGESDYTAWINGRDATTYWQTSGRSSSGTINAHLRPGTYYLVFTNTFPPLSQKRVQLDVSVSYKSSSDGGQGR